jgi:hypothetical protein
MSWYAAHVVMVVERKDPGQKHVPFWENIILVKAASEAEAFDRAEKRAREDEGDEDGSFRWDGHPARWVFGGIRKLTLCTDASKWPGDGSEVSYLEFEAPTREALARYLQGKPVSLRCIDRFPETGVSTPRLVS